MKAGNGKYHIYNLKSTGLAKGIFKRQHKLNKKPR